MGQTGQSITVFGKKYSTRSLQLQHSIAVGSVYCVRVCMWVRVSFNSDCPFSYKLMDKLASCVFFCYSVRYYLLIGGMREEGGGFFWHSGTSFRRCSHNNHINNNSENLGKNTLFSLPVNSNKVCAVPIKSRKSAWKWQWTKARLQWFNEGWLCVCVFKRKISLLFMLTPSIYHALIKLPCFIKILFQLENPTNVVERKRERRERELVKASVSISRVFMCVCVCVCVWFSFVK